MMGPRFQWLVGLVAVIACGVVSAPAMASIGIHTTVKNDTDYPVSLRVTPNGDSHCWNQDDLAGQKTVNAHRSFEYYSSVKNGSGTSCGSGIGAWQSVSIYFQQPGGLWTYPWQKDAQDSISTSDPNDWTGDEPSGHHLDQFQLYHSSANRVFLKNRPQVTTWFPASPAISGTSGDGLFCVTTTDSSGSEPYKQTIYVEPKADCSSVATAAAAGAGRSSRAVSSVPARVRALSVGSGLSADQGRVYNLLTMFKGACDLLDLSSSCAVIPEDSRWDWASVVADIKDVTAIDPPPTAYDWTQVNPPYVSQDNETNVSGSLGYTFTYSYGSTQSTATTEGFKVGAAYEYKNPVSPNKWTFSAEFNFSATQTETTGTTQSTSISTSVATQPDGWTYLYGFDGEATNGFHYVGDLTLGDTAGAAEPLRTPVPANIGYSPATVQPCVGYLVGTGNVSGSAQDLDAQAIADGYSKDDPNLSLDEREFLGGAPLLNALDVSPCPGFPDDYRSGFGFDGAGTLSALALGGTSNSGNAWFPELGSITTCAYFYPNDGELSNSVGQDSPCGSLSNTRRAPGNLIRVTGRKHVSGMRYYAPGAVITPTARSEAVVGDSQPHKIILGDGTFNIVKGGSGDETVLANGKAAVVQAGSGHDVIKGGSGYDTLIGGSGRDELVAGTGAKGALIAGSGDTELISGPRSHSALVGGPGNDTFVIRDTPRIGVFGGRGDDTFYLYGKHATDSIVAQPGGGIDRLFTDHSLTLPQDVELGGALAAGVTLRGVVGTEELVGSAKGHDTLIAGPGEERLIGAGADNILVLNGLGFDRATGGPGGRNRFVLGGRTFNDSVPRGKVIDAASQITNFRPAKGDRLVLSAKDFGAALLSHGLTFVEGRDPRATSDEPTLAFDTARKLLTFDPDGAGPRSPRVVATLDGFGCSVHASTKTVGADRLGIHVVDGRGCLPTTAVEITH
jgi:Ca2+-binding RTX toxin-like protein